MTKTRGKATVMVKAAKVNSKVIKVRKKQTKGNTPKSKEFEEETAYEHLYNQVKINQEARKRQGKKGAKLIEVVSAQEDSKSEMEVSLAM